ncbi:glutamyl-trna amidotransferase [Diplodia corticola]|uniref:Glutamyl-trna amidotransferase n=1 Tax=Diplodia corticola TaxID=236234 RepID=A0A1J9S2A7_9PEZI|nr:glutamyl-trna amidotransferase [Diplodia corticola]OJD34140.1 glutamyl-trna amidotransferase [Diplodia corticola]
MAALSSLISSLFGFPRVVSNFRDAASNKGPQLDHQFTSCFLGEKHFLIEQTPLKMDSDLRECGFAKHENDADSCKETGPRRYCPATVISSQHGKSGSELLSHIDRLLEDEDFSEAFLQHTIFLLDKAAKGYQFPDAEVRTVLQNRGCDRIYMVDRRSTSGILSEGPCFIHGLQVHRTWRLFPDALEAFQLPLVQEAGSDRFIPVHYMWDGQLMIPVPSRLHYPKDSGRPLAGLRVGVKDVIDLRGVKTSAQCRAWLNTFPACHTSAECMAKLMELGAVPVGKTKCTQFASSEQPTADWIEFLCPWNPRADGYLSPRGSSAGSGSAIAGYPWLDVGIGTDTGGSIRGPAAVMGLFAIRPTVGVSSLRGVLPAAKSMDTVGFICRDAKLCRKVTREWFSGSKSQTGKELRTLLFPIDYWSQWPSSDTLDLRDKFVSDFEKFLGLNRIELSLAERWEQDDPPRNGMAMNDYLQSAFMNILWKTYWDASKEFREEHERKFGSRPYVNPVIQHCWKRGEMVSAEDHEEAQRRIRVYAEWLNNKVLLPGHVMIYPSGDLSPFYRDVYRPPPDELPPYDWSQREDHQASLAGVPALTFPIGQTPYTSKITEQAHLLPVNMEIMGPKGSDYDLTDLILRMMCQMGYDTVVETGKLAYKQRHATHGDSKQYA